MSARKRGRLVGLVLVLAAILGVTGTEFAVGGGPTAVQEANDNIDWF